jgi:uncharacterized repeat protein (TIGR01451 family)
MSAGNAYYGAFDLGTSPGNEGDIGRVPVNLYRHDDDVTKSAPEEAEAGETFTYTLRVEPNVTDVDLTYNVTDTIPAGTTYVEGSATATGGTVSESGGTIYWDGVMEVSSSEPVTVTFQVTVQDDAPGEIINQAQSITDNPGDEVDVAEATTLVTSPTSVTTSAFNVSGTREALPWLGLGITVAGLAAIATWRRRR